MFDTDRGRALVVLFVVYSGIIIVSTTVFMNGIIFVALLEQFDVDEAKTSLVGALNGGLLTLFGPLASLLMAKYSCRTCIFLGGILAVTSCLTSAFTKNVDSLILTYGVIGGIGNCLASTPFVVVLGFYFHERRDLVIAISQAVVCCGFFLAAPLALCLLDKFCLQGTFLLLGGINAHLCVIAMVCKPSSTEKQILNYTKDVRVPEDDVDKTNADADMEWRRSNVQIIDTCNEPTCMQNHNTDDRKLFENIFVTYTSQLQAISVVSAEQCTKTVTVTELGKDVSIDVIHSDIPTKSEQNAKLDKQKNVVNKCTVKDGNKIKDKCNKDSKTKNFLANFRLMKDLRFLLFLLSGLSWNFTLSICIMHLPNYMIVAGADEIEISAIITCFGASNLAGRFLAAMTVGKSEVDSQTLYAGMLGVAAAMTLGFPLYSGPIGNYLFAGAIGIYVGGPNSLMTPISLKMVRLEDLPTARGLECFFSGLGNVPGPFVAGLLYSMCGAYELSFVCGGCILLLGCIFAMVSAASRQDQVDIKDRNCTPNP